MFRLKNFLNREKYIFGAFGITMLALIIYAIAAKIAPFGPNAFLSMDLHGQYYPMMVHKLEDFISSWSWNGSLGFSSAAQSAYYTNSIFLLLMAPFSGFARICAMDMMIFIKIALSAAFFAFYLEKKFQKYDVFTMVFGVAYALSAYMTAFLLQPMWLDVVLFLPLILYALDRLIAGKNPIPYILLLALAIFSNFYISWALCIFLVFWYFVSLIAGNKKSFRELFKTTAVFGVSSLAAGMLCAFSLFPLVAHMDHWISSSIGFDKPLEWYHEIQEITDSFSFGLKPSLEYGPANVYCGSAILFLLLTFVLNKTISVRKRISFTLLAAFLFVSFEFNLLDFIWHGLHFPNQLPGRQSFLFIFLILLMGYETVVSYKGLTVPRAIASFVISFGFFFIGFSKSKNIEGRKISFLVVAAAVVCMILMILWKNRKNLLRSAKVALALVLLADVCANGIFVLCSYGKFSDGTLYAKEEAILDAYKKKYMHAKKDEFYRSEVVPNFTFNPGQIYGFRGISYYSSTMNGDIYHLMEKLGNRVYAKNVSTVYMSTPFQDMMFGVRYHYMKGGRVLSYGNFLEKEGYLSVYESPYALPIAYAVNKNIADIETSTKKGIELQERFIRLASGTVSRIMQKMDFEDVRLNNGRISGDYIYATDPQGEVTYSVDYIVGDNDAVFIETDFKAGNYEIYLNGVKRKTGACNSEPIIDVGDLSRGDKITINIKVKGYSVILYGVRCYTVTDEKLEKAYQKLLAQSMIPDYVSDTEIQGTVTALEDCVLYASIPAEKGWEVYIDGEKQETYDLGMGLLFCDIKAGTHTVEYRYRVPGLALGAGISGVTALALCAVGIFVYGKKPKKSEDSEETENEMV